MRLLPAILLVIVVVLLVGCTDQAHQVELLIRGSKATDLIRGAYAIGEARDTSYVPWLLKPPPDWRISHDYRFYGVTVYQSKMNALRKISGHSPPTPITYLPDSAVVGFYRRWAIKHGYQLVEHSN